MRWTDLRDRNSHESLTTLVPGFGETCANEARAGLQRPPPGKGGLPGNFSEGLALLYPGRSSPGWGGRNLGTKLPAAASQQQLLTQRPGAARRRGGPSGSAGGESRRPSPAWGPQQGPASLPHRGRACRPSAPTPVAPQRPAAQAPAAHASGSLPSPSSPRRSQRR